MSKELAAYLEWNGLTADKYEPKPAAKVTITKSEQLHEERWSREEGPLSTEFILVYCADSYNIH
jgi:hypothetical protein